MLRWEFANGQAVNRRQVRGGTISQSGPYGRDVTATNTRRNSVIPAGGSVAISFTAAWDRVANASPPNITLNDHRCATDPGPVAGRGTETGAEPGIGNAAHRKGHRT